MISYQLAKKLKDAGFPQEPTIDISGMDGPFMGGFYYLLPPKAMDGGEVAPNFLDQRQYETRIHSGVVCAYGEMVKIPQLDEVIEKCGNRFKELKPAYSHGRKSIMDWNASGYSFNFKDFPEDFTVCFGKAHEESLVNLWLALNTK